MKLYNTLTKQTEDVTPLAPPTVTIYTCGPTVYGYPHIGNWFTFIRYDLLIRTLKLSGYVPKWVMNITDVGHLVSDADEGEDKLEKGARREGKTAWDVAKFYGDYFEDALGRLNITYPSYLTKATEHINEQIELVILLQNKGYTYTIDDGVYFDTAKFPKYGDFAQLDLDEQQAGKRVELNVQKRNPTDFALWKFSPAGQQRDMEWDSPFPGPDGTSRKGFPGWHLECSAMAMKYLGETIDIHSGGIEHIPVHHTNEIAQSEAATGKPFSRHWMHTNHISIEGEKISKSLGNGITLEDIEAKGYSLQTLRLHAIESHYRSQSKFSWDSLEAANNRLAGIHALADLRYQTNSDARALVADYFHDKQEEIAAALKDDLSTPEALRILSQVVDEAGQNKLTPEDGSKLEAFIGFIDQALGLSIGARAAISTDQQKLIIERDTARTNKDWAESDRLRDLLKEQGITLRDTALGALWSISL
jgi:cysteinyl-tRNA synthetase